MLNLEEYADYTNSKLDQPRYYLQPNGEMRYVFSGNESAYQADPNNPELYKVITYRNWQRSIYISFLTGLLGFCQWRNCRYEILYLR